MIGFDFPECDVDSLDFAKWHRALKHSIRRYDQMSAKYARQQTKHQQRLRRKHRAIARRKRHGLA